MSNAKTNTIGTNKAPIDARTLLAEELNEKLTAGIVTFKYLKTDGTVREAVGTTKIELIPEVQKPTTQNSLFPTHSTTQRYYDFLKQSWRSLKKESVIQIVSCVKE